MGRGNNEKTSDAGAPVRDTGRPVNPDTSGHSQPVDAGHGRDAGRTSGGGNLGHEQPRDVEEQTHTRNNTGRRPPSK